MDYEIKDNIAELAHAFIQRKLAKIKDEITADAREVFNKQLIEAMADIKVFIERDFKTSGTKMVIEFRISDNEPIVDQSDGQSTPAVKTDNNK